MNDCDALAQFAGGMAAVDGTDPGQFVADFGELTPNQMASRIPGISSSTSATLLNTGQASGYASQYQNTNPDGRAGDPSWNGDQGHHFAAFFQVGYAYGAALGAAMVDLFEGGEALFGPLNFGDIALGRAAVRIGADLKAGTIKPGDVSSKIESLCAK